VLFFRPMSQNVSKELDPSAVIAQMSMSLAMLNATSRQDMNAIAASSVTLMAVAEILGSLASTPSEILSKATTANSPAPATSVQSAMNGEQAGNENLADSEAVAIKPGSDTEVLGDSIDAAVRVIAQTVALSVQDGANYLRNIQTLSTASIGSALANFNTTRNSEDLKILRTSQALVESGTQEYTSLCTAASDILEKLRTLRSTDNPRELRMGDHHSGPLGELLRAVVHALSQATENTVVSQQQANVTAQAALTMGIATMYSIDTAALGRESAIILNTQTAQSTTDNTAAVGTA